jgi:hypothetical protein
VYVTMGETVFRFDLNEFSTKYFFARKKVLPRNDLIIFICQPDGFVFLTLETRFSFDVTQLGKKIEKLYDLTRGISYQTQFFQFYSNLEDFLTIM